MSIVSGLEWRSPPEDMPETPYLRRKKRKEE